jgi:TPR repeat protein
MNHLAKIIVLIAGAIFLIALGACLTGGVTPQDSLLQNKKGNAIIASAQRGDAESQYKYALALLDTGGYFDLDFSINEALVARSGLTIRVTQGMTANEYRESHKGLLFEEALAWLDKASAQQHPLAALKRHHYWFKQCLRVNEGDDRERQLATLNLTTKHTLTLSQAECMASARFITSYFYKHCPTEPTGFADLFYYFQKHQAIEAADVLFLYIAKAPCHHQIDTTFWLYYDRAKYEQSNDTDERFQLRTLAYGVLMQGIAAGTPEADTINKLTATKPLTKSLQNKIQAYAAQIEKNYVAMNINPSSKK